jgi:hypothetical protein
MTYLSADAVAVLAIRTTEQAMATVRLQRALARATRRPGTERTRP